MICSSCGHENPLDNRFCGMCGTPLPHRPITAPGAQSTLSFTRLPLEMARVSQPDISEPRAESEVRSGGGRGEASGADARKGETEARAEVYPQRGGVVLEMPRSDAAPGVSAESPLAAAEKDPSLEHYVANFRYLPPDAPEELTMTADRPVLDGKAKYHTDEPVSVAEEPLVGKPSPQSRTITDIPVVAEPVPTRNEVPVAAAEEMPVTSIEAPLREAPEAEAPVTEAPVRSRFLDLSEPEPAAEESEWRSGPSIVGPSFLGLSDPPSDVDVPTAYDYVEPAQPTSHWRAWLAVAVLLVFGALGFMEWRSENNSPNTGLIGSMKMQVRKLKGNKAAADQGAASTDAPTSPDANAKPNMEVVPPSKPAPQQQPGATSSANDSSNGSKAASAPQPQPGNGAPSTSTSSNAASPPAGTPAASNATGPSASNETAPNPAETNTDRTPALAKPSPAVRKESANAPAQPATERRASPSTLSSKETPKAKVQPEPEVVTHKFFPGEEEMAKANSASDAAATAVWLWKATAKGNPDAPVRLADMYIKGDGVPRSCEQAMVLLKSAAGKENARARSRLGSLYATGVCVPRDRVKAYEWLSSALQVNPNGTWAQQYREQLWAQMNPQERALAQKYR